MELTCQIPWELSGLACSVPTTAGSQESSLSSQGPLTSRHPSRHLQSLSSLPGRKLFWAGRDALKTTTRQVPWDTTPCPSATVQLPLLTLHGPGLWPQLSPLTPSDLDKHSSPVALGLCPALCMGLIEPLSLEWGKGNMGIKALPAFSQLSPRKFSLWSLPPQPFYTFKAYARLGSQNQS